LCLKAAIKKIRRQSQRIIRGTDNEDLDCGSPQGNSPGGSRRSTFILRGEGKTFDALIDQLTSKRRKSEGRSRQSSIGSSGPGSIDRNINDECKETKPNISNQSNDHFRALGSNENLALAPLSRDSNSKIRETVPIPTKVLDAPVIPGTVKTECEKIEEIIITLPKKLGSVSHDYKEDERDQQNGGNYDEILLGSEKDKVENTAVTNTVDHMQAEKERISEAVRLGRISRGDSAIRFLARVSTLKSCNSVDDEVGADKSPINYGCSASYSPMSVSSDNANDTSSIGNRSVGDFVYPDLQSRVRSLRLKSRSISPVSRSGGSPPSKLSTEDYHQMSQKKIGIIVDFNDFDDDDREDKEDEYGPESKEFATPKGQQLEKEQLFAYSAREALAVNDHDIDDSEDDLQYRFGNVTRNVRNSSHFANRSSISMSRGLNSGDAHNLSLINPSNIQNDLKDREVADVAGPTVRNDSYAFQANQWMRASLRLTEPLAGLVTTDTVNNQDLIDQGGDSIGVMPTSIRKADISAASASASAPRSAPLRPASMRVTSDRIPPAPLTRPKMFERSNSSNSIPHAGSVDTVHDQDLIDQGGDRVGEMLSSIRKAGIGAASAPRNANRRPVSMRVTSDRIPPAHVTQPKKQTERSSLGNSMPRPTSALPSTSDLIDQDGDSVSDMLTSIRKAGIGAVPRDTNRRPASMRVTSDRIPPAHVTQPKKSSLGNSMPRPSTASHEAHNFDLVDQDGDSVSDMLTNIRKAGIGAASVSPPRDTNRRPASMRVTSDRIPPAHVTQPKKQTERSSLGNSMPRPSTASHEAHNYDLVDQDGDSVSDMLTNIRKAGIGAASVPRNDNRRPASMRVTSDRIPPAHYTRPKETERRNFTNSMPRPTDSGSFTSGDHDLIDQDGDSVSDMLTNIRRAGIGATSTSPPRTANRRPASMRVSSDMIPPAHGTRPRQTERSSLGNSMQRPTDSGSFTTDEMYGVRDECHPYTSGRRAERERDGGSRSSSVRLSIGRKPSTESHNSSNPALLGRKAFVSVVRHNSSSNINMYDTMNKPRRVSNPVQPPKSKAKEEQANLFNEYLTREFSSSRRAEFQTEMELMSSIMKEKMVQLNDSILKVQMHSDENMQGADLSKSGTVTTDKFNRKSVLEVESDVMESHQMENPMNLNMDLIRLRMRAASIHTDPNTPMRKSSLKIDADGNSVDFMSNPMIAKMRTASITTDPDTPIRRSSLQSNADSTTVDFMSNPMIARMRTASINTDPSTPLRISSLQSGVDSTTVDYMSNPMIAKMRTASITTDPNAPLRRSSLQTDADSNAIEYMRHPISLRSKSIHTEPSTPLRKTSLRLDADSNAVEYVRNSTSMRSKSIHTDPNSPSVKSIFQIDAAKDGDAITNIRNQIKLAFTLNTSAWKPLSPPAVASNMVPRQRDRDGKNGGFIYTAHSDDDDKPDRKRDLFPQTLLTSPPQTDHMRHSINQYTSAHNDSEVTQGRRNDGNLEERNSSQVFLPIDQNQSDRQGQASIDSPSSSMRQSKVYDDRGGNSPDSSCYSYYNYNSENNQNSEDNNTVRDDVNRNVDESSQQHQVGPILLSDISLPEDSLTRGNHTATRQNCSPTASMSTRLEVRGQGHAGSSSHTGKEIITVTSPTDIHTHRAVSTSNQPTPDKLTVKDSNKHVSNMPKIDVALDVLTDVSSCEKSDYQSPESNMNHALALASVWGSPRPEVLY
jgi:hypothetical protein